MSCFRIYTSQLGYKGEDEKVLAENSSSSSFPRNQESRQPSASVEDLVEAQPVNTGLDALPVAGQTLRQPTMARFLCLQASSAKTPSSLMRLLFLVLLLAVVANGGFFKDLGSKVKGVFSGENSIGQKLKNATITGFHMVFNNTAVQKIREKLRKLKDKVVKTLKLTPEMMKSLKERLQKIRFIKTDKIKPTGDTIEEINSNAKVAEDLFQGDILLTDEQTEEIIEDVEEELNPSNRTKRQALKDKRYPNTLWSEGVNFYFAWNATKDRIVVYPEDGCWSFVGRLGGEQALSLGDGCESVSTAAHELGHALGFFHTMSRHDRDRYITPSWLNQFTKQTTATNDNYGMQYDYGSIMHYHGRSASINQKFTMVPFDVKYQETLGSPFISFIELSMLNEHYGCKKRCERSGAAVCQNGGFPHPRDCNKCICPSGYGGPLCDRRPDGCGSTLQARNEWQTLTDTVGLGRGEELEFEKCNYWIESPTNTKIEVKIDSFTRGLATDGCIYAGVEINTQKDQQLTGYRFCAPEDAGQRLTSHSNLVPIMTYNRAFKSTVVLQYRYIDAGGGQRPIIPVDPNDRKTIRPVIPNGGDGQRPVFPPSSRLTTKAAPAENCVDRVSCKDLARTKFCSSSISDATKRAICPKLCGFCN
ncbi:unnamed protein product [Nippostrongylus brasiliensis]|uniref:Metalloendopeptidase n=1 Tax=Nippostrongylus brasiliensis TaxID=27835 RepID=A0A0N4XYQ8_NIPBR|nr:unnamed protein product [Nippostrongylus brasiliensis]